MSPRATRSVLPRSPDISHEVMGFMVLTDSERVLRQLSPGGHPVDLEELKAGVAQSVGLDRAVSKIIDIRRPSALALLNPTLLASSTVQPYVAMLPVPSREAVERALLERGAHLEHTDYGFVLPSNIGKIHVGFVDGYAVVAWRADLLDATARLLGSKLLTHPDAPVALHLEMENVYGAYGAQLGGMLAQLARLADQGGTTGDPQMAFALRGVKSLARYVESVQGLDLLANLDPGGLTLTVRMDGKSEGAWAGYVQQQRPGPAWGVQFLPRDSVLVYTTHASPLGRAEDVEASVDYLAEAMPDRLAAAAQRDRWRRVLQRAAASTDGELAYGVWPGQAGGVGLGGAYRVKDGRTARAAVMHAYDEVSSQLGGLVARSMMLDPQRFASRIVVHKKTARIADTEVDLVEVTVKWPEGASMERRVFQALFGSRMVLATAFVGEQALFAIGADYDVRLTSMIATAHGLKQASLGDEPGFAEALGYRNGSRVSMSYLETARMARFAAGLMAQSSDLDESDRSALAELLRQVGRGAIVSTTNASGRRYEMTTHVPQTAIMGVSKLDGALWRIALSPLVNPPMMPPMPVPPPHVTPTVTHREVEVPTL